MLPPLKQAATPRGTIEYRESGRGNAPALVLLHGLGSNSASFQFQYGPLGERHRVIAWNAPGYCGSTPLGTEEPPAADYADALAALLDVLGIDRTCLVGSSWGTLIATAFAGRYPARVRALILSAPNTGFGGLPAAEQRRQFAERVVPLQLLGPLEMAKRSAERLVAPGTPAEVLDHIRGFGAGLSSEGFGSAMHMMSSTDGIAQIAELEQPILIFAGSEDIIAPAAAHAVKLAAAARNARLVMFPGCGHLLKLEAPDRFNAEVLEFTRKETT
jgi:pimeloyl-ACP methyl ester carboxylesterase